MRNTIAYIIILVLLAGTAALANREPTPFSQQIKKLYAEPNKDSKLVFDIPISVTLLDVSDDHEWYKAQIVFVFGPFKYEYTGWTHIPIDKLIAQKESLAAHLDTQSGAE